MERTMMSLSRLATATGQSVALLIGTAGVALADGLNNEYGYHMGPWGMSWGGSIFHWVMMLIVIAVVVVLLVGAFRALQPTHGGPHGHGHGHGEDAIAVLKKRFARGEIDRAEYDDKLKALRD